MAGNARPGIELRWHSIGPESPEPELLAVLQLSRSIFDPDNETPAQPQLLLSTWKTNLAVQNAALFYATTVAAKLDALDGVDDTTPLGFFFAYPRTHPEIGHETLHLWIAGVHPSARGLGIFPFLMERLKQHARDSCGLEFLSVCTFPKRFEKMFSILQTNGWETVAWREGGEKVLMKLRV